MDPTVKVEALIPKRLTVDFSNHSVCDSAIDNSSCTNFNLVLAKIDQQFIEHKPIKINIFLADNYLTDKSVRELVDFIQAKPKIAKRIIKIDLTSNRLTDQALDDLQMIIKLCSKLKLLKITSNLILIKSFRASSLANNKQIVEFGY